MQERLRAVLLKACFAPHLLVGFGRCETLLLDAVNNLQSDPKSNLAVLKVFELHYQTEPLIIKCLTSKHMAPAHFSLQVCRLFAPLLVANDLESLATKYQLIDYFCRLCFHSHCDVRWQALMCINTWFKHSPTLLNLLISHKSSFFLKVVSNLKHSSVNVTHETSKMTGCCFEQIKKTDATLAQTIVDRLSSILQAPSVTPMTQVSVLELIYETSLTSSNSACNGNMWQQTPFLNWSLDLLSSTNRLVCFKAVETFQAIMKHPHGPQALLKLSQEEFPPPKTAAATEQEKQSSFVRFVRDQVLALSFQPAANWTVISCFLTTMANTFVCKDTFRTVDDDVEHVKGILQLLLTPLQVCLADLNVKYTPDEDSSLPPSALSTNSPSSSTLVSHNKTALTGSSGLQLPNLGDLQFHQSLSSLLPTKSKRLRVLTKFLEGMVNLDRQLLESSTMVAVSRILTQIRFPQHLSRDDSLFITSLLKYLSQVPESVSLANDLPFFFELMMHHDMSCQQLNFSFSLLGHVFKNSSEDDLIKFVKMHHFSDLIELLTVRLADTRWEVRDSAIVFISKIVASSCPFAQALHHESLFEMLVLKLNDPSAFVAESTCAFFVGLVSQPVTATLALGSLGGTSEAWKQVARLSEHEVPQVRRQAVLLAHGLFTLNGKAGESVCFSCEHCADKPLSALERSFLATVWTSITDIDWETKLCGLQVFEDALFDLHPHGERQLPAGSPVAFEPRWNILWQKVDSKAGVDVLLEAMNDQDRLVRNRVIEILSLIKRSCSPQALCSHKQSAFDFLEAQFEQLSLNTLAHEHSVRSKFTVDEFFLSPSQQANNTLDCY
eukprot:m.186060 g.186060  ORF g.186060 m.186060 type:complete len:836 (+) comp25580_c0_seq3:132-2639(+)